MILQLILADLGTKSKNRGHSLSNILRSQSLRSEVGWSAEGWTLALKGSRDPVGQGIPYKPVLSMA